ncbi:adenylate kinase [Xanthomonas tesorieronis]|uniref:deoxynucleotide monophosphate kinase family protein n=1 Tax=Xanthomonas tesorieronis TaxID=3160839 RepID=UPI0035155409
MSDRQLALFPRVGRMKIIGIAGKAGSGKDTLAGYLVANHGFVRVALADPLRRFVSDITGLSMDELTAGPMKEAPLQWLGGTSPRRLMQTVGTEWGRDMIDRDLWLKVARRRIEAADAAGATGVVIPDIRFENEAMLVRGMGGEVVVVERPDVAAVTTHSSERPLASGCVDSVIPNDGSLRDLEIYALGLAN